MPINYSDLVLANQSWNDLTGLNLEVDIPGAYDGDVKVINLAVDVEFWPIKFNLGDKVTARLSGRETAGDGSGTLIENPADIIEDVLKEFLGHTSAEIDSASFTNAATSLADTKFAFCLFEGIDAKSLLNELAKQARCYLFPDDGKFKLVYRPNTLSGANRSITNLDVTGFLRGTKLFKAGMLEISNRVIVRYAQDYNRTVAPFRKIVIAEDADSIDTYGTREKIIEAFAIQATDAANNLAFFTLDQEKRDRYHYVFQTFHGNVDIQRGDIISITDSKWGLTSALGMVVGIRYIPPSRIKKRAGIFEFTLLMDPIEWFWTEVGGSDPESIPFAVGEAGIYFGGGNSTVNVADPDSGSVEPVARFESSTGDLFIKGDVVEDEATFSTASVNPIDWDSNSYNPYVVFSPLDNEPVMAIDGDGNLRLRGHLSEDYDSSGLQDESSYVGGDNDITNDSTHVYFNADGIRIAECDMNAFKLLGELHTDSPAIQLGG